MPRSHFLRHLYQLRMPAAHTVPDIHSLVVFVIVIMSSPVCTGDHWAREKRQNARTWTVKLHKPEALNTRFSVSLFRSAGTGSLCSLSGFLCLLLLDGWYRFSGNYYTTGACWHAVCLHCKRKLPSPCPWQRICKQFFFHSTLVLLALYPQSPHHSAIFSSFFRRFSALLRM